MNIRIEAEFRNKGAFRHKIGVENHGAIVGSVPLGTQ
jgi:hypothetical protein